MIDLKIYQNSIENLQPGETERYNHIGCEAGADHRRRLYITRTTANPRQVVGYCHNCQQGGVSANDAFESYRDNKFKSNVALATVTDDVEPLKVLTDTSQWTNDGYTWLVSSGLLASQVEKYGIGEDPNTSRIYLPRYARMYRDGKGFDFNGYQLRKTDSTKGPKYLTILKERDVGFSTLFSTNSDVDDEIGVVVEDLVSGIHVLEAFPDVGVRVVVNYGVQVNLEALHSLAHLPKVYIWLDNDGSHVLSQADTMTRTLAMMSQGKVTQVPPIRSDPKHYKSEEIRGVLNG